VTNRKPKQEKEETLVEVAGAIGISLAILIALMWFLGSHKIVYYSAPVLWTMATPWYFVDPDKWQGINAAYVTYRSRPGDIPLSYYMSFVNVCLKPLAVVVACCSSGYIAMLFLGKGGQSIRRVLTPIQAEAEIAKVFPAIIPVQHLGAKLVANQLPLWRRQTFPEDVWMKGKVNGQPMVERGRLISERVQTYFRGGEAPDGPIQKRGGRRWSGMLGYQVVDLIEDHARANEIVFSDRFSPQGKVIFALLCAHAFGGREGKADYKKAADQLNRSCAGQDNGLPNLTVAQWLYTKYRQHEMAHKLFMVHHWEYSYLFALFLKAKVTGKATHTEFIWLKPLDRILFYVLNTVGRATPPVEAAAAFSQFDYETRVAKARRLPLVMGKDGKLVHHIAVGTAAQALEVEFERYRDGSDNDDTWWHSLQTWRAAGQLHVVDEAYQAAVHDADAQSRAAIAQAQAHSGDAELDEFDKKMSANASAREIERRRAYLEAIEMAAKGGMGSRGADGGFDLV